ncbi:MAG: helix-turn-helix transcriptional regulator [Clostridia bacterium]|nr:helix-turn-helix transcriptional regulator [Clostridia bacterium]
MNNIGETIRKHRRSEGLTQEQLGKRLGVSSSTIGMYEQGRRAPNKDMLLKICEEFSISADNLLGLSEPTCEAVDIIKEMSDRIRYSDNLTFNGAVINSEDREKLLNAIELATVLALSKKNI